MRVNANKSIYIQLFNRNFQETKLCSKMEYIFKFQINQEEWSVAETFGKQLQVKVEKGWLKKPHLNKYHFSTMYKDLRYLHQEFEQVSIWICKCRVVIWQPRLYSSLCWLLLTLGHESSVNGASTILLPQQRNGKSVLLHTAAAMEG